MENKSNKRLLMKYSLTILFFMCGILWNTLAAQDVNLSLTYTNTSIREIIKEIETKSGYSILVRATDIPLDEKISIETRNTSLEENLEKVFSGKNVRFEYLDKQVLVYKATGETLPEKHVVRRTVSGTVTDRTTEPIIGANVVIKGTTDGTITNLDGEFILMGVPVGGIIQISYIGYLTREITYTGESTLNIRLEEDTRKLDDVVIVAYGTQNKRNVTGSMETVKFEGLTDIPVAQFAQKLQGQVSGVQINQGTGKPGQGINVRVRGSASISTESTPLYVVDGFPIVGDINNINPNEIESITILKDAAATSLYGSRAAFGVVLITTTRAKVGETRVNVNAYMGLQQVPKTGRPEMMTGAEWAQFKKESYEDLGQAVPEAFQNPARYGKGYDWYDAMLRTAMISDYSVSISAGKENFTSSVVLGYFNQQGVLRNSDYNRFTVRSNMAYTILPNLKANVNIAPSFSYDNAPPSDGAFFGGGGLLDNARLTPPILHWKNEDGTMPVTVTTPGITSFETPNWVRSVEEITNKTKWNRLLSNGYLEYEPIKGLFLKTSINVDLGQRFIHYFEPSTAGRAFTATPNSQNAKLSEKNYRYYSWLNENTIMYEKQLGEHTFDVLGGYTVQKFRSDEAAISGSNFPDDRIQTINAAVVKDPPTMDIQQWSMISYLTRLNYSYKGRYLLGASIRRDGSSRFGSNNKWGNFPSVSAGWIVTDESFMEKLPWLSFMKVRGSYGSIGNNNIGNYTQYNVVSVSKLDNEIINSVFGNTVASGSAVTNLGNDDLGWEITRQLDLGFDVGFINNRINFTYDYYRKTTSNLLYALPIPRESGFSTLTGNVGKVKFWGHEFSVHSNNLIGAFKWQTNFNIAFSDNKVLELSGPGDAIYAYAGIVSTVTRVGGRIGQFYGPIQEGVYVNQADFDNSPKLVDSQVGTIKFRDINEDGEITLGDTDGDKTELGNPFPKFIFGLTNNFSWKGFDLSIVMSGSYGNKIVAYEEGVTNLDGVFNVLKEVQDRWRSPENPGSGKYGKTTGATERDRGFHSRSVYDGSHLAIKNITLGYNIPVTHIKHISNIRVYGSIQQVHVFTKYKYGNPEAGVNFDGNNPSPLLQGIDFSTYPVPRTFTIGLNLTIL